jgi:hypothetical protein
MTLHDALDRVIADVAKDGITISRPQCVRALNLMQCTAAEYLACRDAERGREQRIDQLLDALERDTHEDRYNPLGLTEPWASAWRRVF